MSAESTNASKPTSSKTVTIENEEQTVDPPILRLRLMKPKHRKSVQWTETTIDNEHMNKKKSKCCCIYEKPRTFDDLVTQDDDDDDEDEDECDNCHGHVERRKKVNQPAEDSGEGTSQQEGTTSEAVVLVQDEDEQSVPSANPSVEENNINNVPHVT